MQANATSNGSRPPSLSHEWRRNILGALIAACIASTAIHYTHNYIHITHYPQSDLFPNHVVRLAIVIAWPSLTVVGLLGFWLYAQGRYMAAYPALGVYSLLGLATFGHFTSGSPHIPPFFYATIFTDGLLGFAILAFAHWSAVTLRRDDRPADARA